MDQGGGVQLVCELREQQASICSIQRHLFLSTHIKCGVPQGSILAPLLFPI